MLIPHEQATDIVGLRLLLFSVMSLPLLLGMAGGYPCCCTEPDSSTSTVSPPTSTSTSTSTSTGEPPLPPAGSTSTVDSPLPPRRSSSVGSIVYFECECCRNSEGVPDQWQVEVAGVVDTLGCSPSYEQANGVYIVDGLAFGMYTQSASCSTVQSAGCSNGNSTDKLALLCPDERLYQGWWFTPAGIYGRAVNPVVDVMAEFSIAWRGAFGNPCNGPWMRWRYYWTLNAAKPAFAPLTCLALTNPETDLPDCTQMDEIDLPVSTATPGSTCFAFTITGF